LAKRKKTAPDRTLNPMTGQSLQTAAEAGEDFEEEVEGVPAEVLPERETEKPVQPLKVPGKYLKLQ